MDQRSQGPSSATLLTGGGPTARRRVVTIRDVAHAAGVAVGTASVGLKGRGKMRPETRARIMEAAERLQFRPNDLVQSLLRGRTFTVGLLTSDVYGRFSIPIIEGIEDALQSAEISMFLCNGRGDPARERRHLEALLAKQVDGIIVAGQQIDLRDPVDIGSAPVPLLYAFTQVSDQHALSLIPDDAQGTRLAMEHLLRAGRRRIAHVTVPQELLAARIRHQTMCQILAEHGLDLPDERVFFGPWWQAAFGFDATNHLLDQDPHIDAIFCGADLLASGVLDALRERGVRVPDDVAVVGFDNWEIVARGTRPPLTSVDMNLQDLGRTAGARLLGMIEGEAEPGVIHLPCRLVVRDSCGAPPST